MSEIFFRNPFRPGAGHMPPHLAGREEETKEFCKLLTQDIILENLVLTGLRGVGKTVLLDTFKPLALEAGWRWVGTDLSESTSISEEIIALRLITDLSVTTSDIIFQTTTTSAWGFGNERTTTESKLTYEKLIDLFKSTPGLISDKLKAVLETVWNCIQQTDNTRGIIFAYDEAQTMSDHSKKEQYPLALILDVFQSLQKKEIPFMLVLTGLPTLFPKLVESRTFSERMFRVIFLDKLNEEDSRDAITTPINKKGCPIHLTDESTKVIIKVSGGYPYFIQFICKELYDIFLQQHDRGKLTPVPVEEITRKLDNDFFAGRWAKATDRQRQLLHVIASLPNSDKEFTVQEIVEQAEEKENPFGNSHVNQMLATLANRGLVYKNRYGKYSFAVPLLEQFIKRQSNDMK